MLAFASQPETASCYVQPAAGPMPAGCIAEWPVKSEAHAWPSLQVTAPMPDSDPALCAGCWAGATLLMQSQAWWEMCLMRCQSRSAIPASRWGAMTAGLASCASRAIRSQSW